VQAVRSVCFLCYRTFISMMLQFYDLLLEQLLGPLPPCTASRVSLPWTEALMYQEMKPHSLPRPRAESLHCSCETRWVFPGWSRLSWCVFGGTRCWSCQSMSYQWFWPCQIVSLERRFEPWSCVSSWMLLIEWSLYNIATAIFFAISASWMIQFD